jgi:hypothetical protein
VNKTNADILCCRIQKISTSGIILEKMSHARVKETTIEECIHGVTLRSSSDMKMENCLLKQITYNSTFCYDCSFLDVTDSSFIESGLNFRTFKAFNTTSDL